MCAHSVRVLRLRFVCVCAKCMMNVRTQISTAICANGKLLYPKQHVRHNVRRREVYAEVEATAETIILSDDLPAGMCYVFFLCECRIPHTVMPTQRHRKGVLNKTIVRNKNADGGIHERIKKKR